MTSIADVLEKALEGKHSYFAVAKNTTEDTSDESGGSTKMGTPAHTPWSSIDPSLQAQTLPRSEGTTSAQTQKENNKPDQFFAEGNGENEITESPAVDATAETLSDSIPAHNFESSAAEIFSELAEKSEVSVPNEQTMENLNEQNLIEPQEFSETSTLETKNEVETEGEIEAETEQAERETITENLPQPRNRFSTRTPEASEKKVPSTYLKQPLEGDFLEKLFHSPSSIRSSQPDTQSEHEEINSEEPQLEDELVI